MLYTEPHKTFFNESNLLISYKYTKLQYKAQKVISQGSLKMVEDHKNVHM